MMKREFVEWIVRYSRLLKRGLKIAAKHAISAGKRRNGGRVVCRLMSGTTQHSLVQTFKKRRPRVGEKEANVICERTRMRCCRSACRRRLNEAAGAGKITGRRCCSAMCLHTDKTTGEIQANRVVNTAIESVAIVASSTDRRNAPARGTQVDDRNPPRFSDLQQNRRVHGCDPDEPSRRDGMESDGHEVARTLKRATRMRTQ